MADEALSGGEGCGKCLDVGETNRGGEDGWERLFVYLVGVSFFPFCPFFSLLLVLPTPFFSLSLYPPSDLADGYFHPVGTCAKACPKNSSARACDWANILEKSGR